jgi:microcystin-dependent protein
MEAYIGTIMMWAPNFAPRGWAFCNGQIMSIAQNTALFSLLGTTYGGNGQTTFALPNLQGRVAIGTGQSTGTSNYTLGESAGSENVTLTPNQMPQHVHTTSALNIAAFGAAGDQAVPGPTVVLASPTSGGRGIAAYSDAAPDTTLKPGSISGNVDVAGGSQPFPVVQPYQALNFIICTEGIFPPRN